MKPLTDSGAKVKREMVRDAMLRAGIRSFPKLALRADCTVTAIYMWMERPSRFPHVNRKVKKLIGI